MRSKYQRNNIGFLLLICLALFALQVSCRSTTHRASTQARLKEYIDTIKVINTHEHQRWDPAHEGYDFNFYTLLAHTYLKHDLVSAGAAPLDLEDVNKGDLDALWNAYGSYFDFARNTSYYSHFLEGLKILYGFDEPFFTKEVCCSRVCIKYAIIKGRGGLTLKLYGLPPVAAFKRVFKALVNVARCYAHRGICFEIKTIITDCKFTRIFFEAIRDQGLIC